MVHQYRAARWTFLGSGLRHEKFSATLQAISPAMAARIAAAAKPRLAPAAPARQAA